MSSCPIPRYSTDSDISICNNTREALEWFENLDYKEILDIDKDILSLEEFFEIIDISKIKIYLDIKGNVIDIVTVLNNLIKENKFIYNIFIASFNLIIIHELYKINSKLQLGFITESLYSKDIFLKIIDESCLKFISFHWTMLEESVINFLHENNIMILSYTSKNKEILSFIDEFDIDGIVTNGKLNDYRQGILKKPKK